MTAMTMSPEAERLLAGTAYLTIRPAESFLAAQAAMGNTYHPVYEYKVEAVEMDAGNTVRFVRSREKGRWVYLGVLDTVTGVVRLTVRSAFPAHATRVRVLRKALARLWAGEDDAIVAAGWSLEVVQESEENRN